MLVRRKPKRKYKALPDMMAMSSCYDPNLAPCKNTHDPIDDIDIDAEYQKILEKKSSLSSAMRARVVRIYERRRNA